MQNRDTKYRDTTQFQLRLLNEIQPNQPETDGGRGSGYKAHTYCRVIFCRFGQYEEISIHSFNIL